MQNKWEKTSFNNYMQMAIDVASNGKKRNKNTKEIEIPIGCIIVDNKNHTILAKSCNRTQKTKNPTQHAEIICINTALKKINSDRLTNCSMYVTLEPCGMCASAIALAKIGNLYIGCLSKKTGAVISNCNYFDSKICNHKPKIFYPIMEKECTKLICDFFKEMH